MTSSFETYGRKGPNARLRLPLTDEEKRRLGALYNHDGAWSHAEAVAYLGESRWPCCWPNAFSACNTRTWGACIS